MSYQNINIQVISLKDKVDRRAHIHEQFKSLGLNYEFFDATSKEKAIEVCQGMSLNFVSDSLTLGELGCFMSHISLWSMMLERNMPYLVIFEDDVILSEGIHEILPRLNVLIKEHNIIKLETMQTPAELGEKTAISEDLYICPLLSEHMGASAYVVSNEYAKLMLNKLKLTNIDKPIDHFLFKDWLNDFSTYQVFPAVAIQDDVLHSEQPNLISTLEIERKQRMSKSIYPSTLMGKSQRELSRLVKQLSPRYWAERYNLKSKIKGHTIIPFEGKI